MRISLGCKYEDIGELHNKNGFGYATERMLTSLTNLGYEWDTNDATADVEIWFEQPHNIRWSNENMYKIAFVPWESTALPNTKNFLNIDGQSWEEVLIGADEVWTPSPLIADWLRQATKSLVPVYVYEHGVDPIWKPKVRSASDKFKFLHVGAEASRKGGWEAMRAFRMAFNGNDDVELNLKIISDGWKIGALRKINIINGATPIEDLIQMFHDNHVYVYPSYGEGFGLTPLQAMATGMPTITLPAWAPYAQYLNPDLCVSSKFVKSPWPALHPGAMLKPNLDSVIDAMRFSYQNYDKVHEDALNKVAEITAYYDWDRLTKEAFENLEKRLKNS